MRGPLASVVVLLGALGCAGPAGQPVGSVSCQPFGYTPAPIAFSFAPGSVDASRAEETAVALYRACHGSAGTVSNLTSSTSSATGSFGGPNAGQSVWQVQVSATVTDPSGATYQSHYWIEVNQSTGVPTLIAYG